MRPFSLYLSKKKKQFSRFILYRASRLEQFDHSRNPFRVLFFLSGRSPGTIRPLAKPFSRFILYRAGRLEQFDHSRNPFRVLFFLSGRSPGTIRPLAKPFLRFFYYRAGCPKEFDPFFIKKKQQKKQQKVSRLPNDLFLDFYISL